MSIDRVIALCSVQVTLELTEDRQWSFSISVTVPHSNLYKCLAYCRLDKTWHKITNNVC